jgi:hypothetical protein
MDSVSFNWRCSVKFDDDLLVRGVADFRKRTYVGMAIIVAVLVAISIWSLIYPRDAIERDIEGTAAAVQETRQARYDRSLTATAAAADK